MINSLMLLKMSDADVVMQLPVVTVIHVWLIKIYIALLLFSSFLMVFYGY